MWIENAWIVDTNESIKPELTQEEINNATVDYDSIIEEQDWEDSFIEMYENEDLNSEKLEFLLDVSRAKEDWKITFNELINLNKKLINFDLYWMDKISDELSNITNKILNNWINITDENREEYFNYIKERWYTIPNDILDKRWNISITVEWNNIVEEWFFSTSLNNDWSLSIWDNDLDGNINNIEITEELSDKKDIICDKLLDIETNSDADFALISNMIDIVNENYDSLNNEQKIKLLSTLENISIWNIEWLKEDLFIVFDSSNINRTIMMWLMATAAIVISAPISVPLAIWTWIVVWWTTLYTLNTIDYKKEIKYDYDGKRNKYIADKNLGNFSDLYDGIKISDNEIPDFKYIENIYNKINNWDFSQKEKNMFLVNITEQLSRIDSNEDLEFLSDNIDILVKNMNLFKVYTWEVYNEEWLKNFHSFINNINTLDSDIYDRLITITKKWFYLNNNSLEEFLWYIEDRETYNKMVKLANRKNQNNIDSIDDLIYKAT